MKRREFLAALVTIAPVPAIAAFGRIPRHRAVLIQQSKLAGFQYHEGERLWPRLQVGDRLNLIREPENKYDKRAVRVEWHGRKLGYVPRRDNAAVSQMLDRGQLLEARIKRLREALDPWERIAFRVELVA